MTDETTKYSIDYDKTDEFFSDDEQISINKVQSTFVCVANNMFKIKDWNDFYRIVETKKYFKVIPRDNPPEPGNGYLLISDKTAVKEKTLEEWVNSKNIHNKQVIYYENT